jgi:hypothetical protein
MVIGVLPRKIGRELGDKVFTMVIKIMGIREVRGLRELQVVIMEDTSVLLELFSCLIVIV